MTDFPEKQSQLGFRNFTNLVVDDPWFEGKMGMVCKLTLLLTENVVLNSDFCDAYYRWQQSIIMTVHGFAIWAVR